MQSAKMEKICDVIFERLLVGWLLCSLAKVPEGLKNLKFERKIYLQKKIKMLNCRLRVGDKYQALLEETQYHPNIIFTLKPLLAAILPIIFFFFTFYDDM